VPDIDIPFNGSLTINLHQLLTRCLRRFFFRVLIVHIRACVNAMLRIIFGFFDLADEVTKPVAC
jgi:hypothetical protein